MNKVFKWTIHLLVILYIIMLIAVVGAEKLWKLEYIVWLMSPGFLVAVIGLIRKCKNPIVILVNIVIIAAFYLVTALFATIFNRNCGWIRIYDDCRRTGKLPNSLNGEISLIWLSAKLNSVKFTSLANGEISVI